MYEFDSPWGSAREFDARLDAVARARSVVSARLDELQRAVRDARETWVLCTSLVDDLEGLNGYRDAELSAGCEQLRLVYDALLADLCAFRSEHVFLPDATTEEV